MRLIPSPRAAGWARRRALALALTLLPPLAPALGCASTQGSQIEQGQAITTGKEPYDTFFQAVRDLRKEALTAESETASARSGAARALGIKGEADASAAIEAARAMAAKLRDEGVLLHLELTPEAKLVSANGKVKIKEEDRGVLDALEASARSSLAASRGLDELAGRAVELQKKRSALLAQSQAAFSDAPERGDEVNREMAAAERVLAEATDLTRKHAALASKFALDLAFSLETGASEPRRPGGRKGPASGDRPAAPAPAKPPKPAGGDDFEP